MRLATGTRLGPYEVLAPLGAGGMGEVYRARDPQLGRDVAIKVLPASFQSDPDRVARFEREARTLATLNHPHIGAIYGYEVAGDVRALVLELVNGPTLAERLRSGCLPMREALTMARQIAEALEAAHERGTIHRDLKPVNIKVTPEGTLKVLDFGLAKAIAGDAASSDFSQAPTITDAGTRQGLIIGTPAYMSPEQARGHSIDKRTDIWAFGCVFYEMLTGRPAFAGQTTSDTVAKILEREADWNALPPSTSAAMRTLLRRCLHKDARGRLRDIGDARLEIEESLKAPVSQESASAEVSSAADARPWFATGSVLAAGGAVTLLIAGFFLAPWFRAVPAPSFGRVVRLVSTAAHEFGPALSPDGKWVAYLSNARGPTDVWVKFIAGGDPLNLTASSGLSVQSQDYINGLEISPDGTLIAFAAGPSGAGQSLFSTWVIPAPLGGVPRGMLRPPYQGLRWSPDGARIAYMRARGSAGDGLMVADADGQNEREIIKPEGGRHIHWLRWSPDGQFVYFNYGIQNFNTEPTEIFRVRATGGAIEPVIRTARRAVFPVPSADGRGLFYAANPDGVDLGLWWRDLRSGADSRITSGLGEYSEPYVSADGRRLVGTVVDVRQALARVPVVFDRPATVEHLTDGFSGDFDPAWSPNGNRLLFTSSRTGNRNIWSVAADLSKPTPLTSGTTIDERPVVSPDGEQVAFVSDRAGRRGVWTVSVNGGTPRLIGSADVLDTISWSPDGRTLVFAVAGGSTPQLMKMSVSDGQTTHLPTPAAASAPAWSPRDDVIAYLEPRQDLDKPSGTYVRFITSSGQPLYPGMPDVVEQLGNGFLAWSSDGRRLAAIGLPGARAGYIWIVEPESPTPLRKLLDLEPGVFLRGATWTRDGSAIIVGHIRWGGDIFLAERTQ